MTQAMTPERRRGIEGVRDDIEQYVDTPDGRWLRPTLNALNELLAELDRITVIANEYAAQLATGPLACRHCGAYADNVVHRPLKDCPLELDGMSCREPELHHAFEPKEAL